MAKKGISSQFFLISFLPALVYWYLEENYPLKIAIGCGLLLAIFEIMAEYFFTKHIHQLSKINFFLLAFMGGLSLLGDNGIWFRLTPSLTGLFMGIGMMVKLKMGKGFLEEMMVSMDKKIPVVLMRGMEFHLSLFFMFYAAWMGYVALNLSVDSWIFYKTFGLYLAFFIFLIGEVLWQRNLIKKIKIKT